MIATLNSQALAVELRLLNKIVPGKPVIPILSHVLLRAELGALRFYATDLEVGLSSSCSAQVEAEGSMALPAAKLLAMVEQFPDADVQLTLDHPQKGLQQAQATVRCGQFKSRLQAQPFEDFPPQPSVEGTECVLDAISLSRLIAKTRHATSSNAKRHLLNGALLKLTGTTAAMVATDGKRLVLATTSRTGPDAEFIVPSKTMDLLIGHLDAGDASVTVGPRHLFFRVGERMLTSRTLDGQYPGYERIVPRDNDKRVTFERMLLMAALKRVILAAEENGAVYFNVKAGENGTSGHVELASASAGVGSADEIVHAQYDGPPVRFCVNGAYVLDFLEVASESTMTMMLKDANSPALIQDGRDCFSVIMLMRGN